MGLIIEIIDIIFLCFVVFVYGVAYGKIRFGRSQSVQPEIIRCKDCKFYTPLNRDTKSGICSLLIHQNFDDDWYCAGAERRTDEPD